MSEISLNTNAKWDTLIRGALVFDGISALPVLEDIALSGGKIASRGKDLNPAAANEVVNAEGMWLMPGLLDIHTHLDLEVEINAGLGEAVRHGTTTVVTGNCSLGTAFGKQCRNGDNPIVDCFARVENVPKPLLQKCVDKITWDNTADYLKHFQNLALGPNIAPLIPHSMLRVEAMGVTASVSREPTREERQHMRQLMTDAMEQGYIGMSTDQIVFHYLANHPNKDKKLPTQFSTEAELREMIELLRSYNRVWQTNPDAERIGRTLKRFFWSSGRLYGKPLKVSALTAIDFDPKPGTWKAMLGLAKLVNSRLLKGKMHFQALGTNFRMWSDGVVAPIFEELVSTRELLACEINDREARLKLLNDPVWQKRFAEDWQTIFASVSKSKASKRNIKTATFQLRFSEMFFDDCAVEAWNGDSLAEVYGRLCQYQMDSSKSGAKNKDEAAVFEKYPKIDSECDYFRESLILFDTSFRWWFDSANKNPEIVEKILFDPNALPGFSDSGAHLTNMAFYDSNLMTLKIAAKTGLARVAQAVTRLTQEPAQFFDLDVGGLELGQQADVVLIDSKQLLEHDSNEMRQLIYHEQFESNIMVNRSDGVVNQVYIRGQRVWEDGCRFTAALGSKTLGRVLTAKSAAVETQAAA